MNSVKVLLRGASGAGKTGIINQAAAECGVPLCGIRTARYIQEGRPFGYDLTVLSSGERLAMVRGEPRTPGMRPAPRFFDEQVRPRLMREAARDGLLIVDELGRFERHDTLYTEALMALWRSDRAMLLVLKKEPLPLNEALWTDGGEALRIDLEAEGRAEAGRRLAVALGARAEDGQPFDCLLWETERMGAAARGIEALRAWQHTHAGRGAAFVRSPAPAIRAMASDAGLIPLADGGPEIFVRNNARFELLAGESWIEGGALPSA